MPSENLIFSTKSGKSLYLKKTFPFIPLFFVFYYFTKPFLAIKNIFNNFDIEYIYCSPLLRARQTAEYLSKLLKLNINYTNNRQGQTGYSSDYIDFNIPGFIDLDGTGLLKT